LKMARGTQPVIKLLKKYVHFSRGDRPLYTDIKVINDLIKTKRVLSLVNKNSELK